MRKVLLVVPSLAYSGTSKQLLLLATGLPRSRFEIRVAVLGDSAGCAEALRARSIEVCELGLKRLLDLGPCWRLRQLIEAFRPDVIHAWHPLSLRFLAIAGAFRPSRLITSAALRAPKWRSFWHELDYWLLRTADRIVAAGSAEAEYYRRQKIPDARIVQVPPGVSPPARTGAREHLCRSLGIDNDARLVLCAGPLLPEKGFREAIWAFEILKYLYDDMHLLLIGSGPDRDRLEQFAGTIGAKRYVHFLGDQSDVSAWFGHSDVVWVPSRRRGGVNVVLEAMAAGRPVVASRLPALAEIVRDGETGFLIDPGDKAALARKTRLLFDDPRRCRQMGEAGRDRSEGNFSAAQLVGRFARLYEEVSGSS